jgi:uncharacterized protein YndB with AHSA1/START domain
VSVPGEYEVNNEATLDASPEEVWEAIATGPGIDSWFMGRTELQPGTGGTVRTDLGGYVQESTITAWDPPHRFGYRSPTQPDGSFLALEWIVEGRAGGSTVVRSIGSGFIGATDWEGEYDSLKKGGALYFHNLTQYVTHFRGRTAVPVSAARPFGDDSGRLWNVLAGGLGLPSIPRSGDAVRLTPVGLDPVDGVVDYSTEEFFGVRSDDGLYRFYPARGGFVVVGHHLFVNPDTATDLHSAWQSWLDNLFPDPTVRQTAQR